MRTRRSVANQERLFTALFKGPYARRAAVETPCCWNCLNYPRTGRARGACSLHGFMVRGQDQRACFLLARPGERRP